MTGPLGFPIAGTLGDAPELVAYKRNRGYPQPPFADIPDEFLPGASSIGKPLGTDFGFLNTHRAAVAAADMRGELAGMNKKSAIAAIKAQAKEDGFQPMNDGTLIHAVAAHDLAGRPYTGDPLPDRLDGHIKAWHAFREVCGVTADTVGFVERTVYNAGPIKVAGTVDFALVRPTGLWMFDIKSTSRTLAKVSPGLDHVMQIVGLGNAQTVAVPEELKVYDLPPVAGVALLYICPDGYDLRIIPHTNPTLVEMATQCASIAKFRHEAGPSLFGAPNHYRLPNPGHQPSLVEVPA